METIQLTKREQLIERIMSLPDKEISSVIAFLDSLEDAEDIAAIEARADETGIPLDTALAELGLTRKELQTEAGM